MRHRLAGQKARPDDRPPPGAGAEHRAEPLHLRPDHHHRGEGQGVPRDRGAPDHARQGRRSRPARRRILRTVQDPRLAKKIIDDVAKRFTRPPGRLHPRREARRLALGRRRPRRLRVQPARRQRQEGHLGARRPQGPRRGAALGRPREARAGPDRRRRRRAPAAEKKAAPKKEKKAKAEKKAPAKKK